MLASLGYQARLFLKKKEEEEEEAAWQRAVMTLGPLPTFLQSLFRRGGWTHASSGTAVPRKSDGDHCPVSHLLFTSPSGEEGTSCLLPRTPPYACGLLIPILPQLALAGWNPCLGA